MRRTFPARYPGNCQTCGTRFDVDDPIGYDTDGEIACVDCLRKTTAPAAPTCAECGLQHRGECW